MDLIKQYIIQSISTASNNLRLTSQQIEVVALLREKISKSANLEADIKGMKKITELSTLAIRLNEIYNYLTQTHVNLFKLSEKFKEHSQYLIKDLNHMLEVANPITFKQALDKISLTQHIQKEDIHTGESKGSFPTVEAMGINVDLSKRKPADDLFVKSESEKIKEKIILEDDKEDEDLFFQNYEAEILKPIKPIDAMLKDLANNKFISEELNNYADIMESNGNLSAKIGFEIIANMHKIVAKALLLIKMRKIMPGREIIEAMRACLIVIVAVVRGKEVDITSYLNRAEEFGRKIQTLKVKD